MVDPGRPGCTLPLRLPLLPTAHSEEALSASDAMLGDAEVVLEATLPVALLVLWLPGLWGLLLEAADALRPTACD